ncbi:MAG: hypothetical protein M0Z56_01390 [Desulfobacteraceae bacterium]|nr:hypothetical protein [Desulfobacteraceae bacterium]
MWGGDPGEKEQSQWKSQKMGGRSDSFMVHRFQKILVRYEKLSDTYMALLHMAAAIIAYRKIGIIYG